MCGSCGYASAPLSLVPRAFLGSCWPALFYAHLVAIRPTDLDQTSPVPSISRKHSSLHSFFTRAHTPSPYMHTHTRVPAAESHSVPTSVAKSVCLFLVQYPHSAETSFRPRNALLLFRPQQKCQLWVLETRKKVLCPKGNGSLFASRDQAFKNLIFDSEPCEATPHPHPTPGTQI